MNRTVEIPLTRGKTATIDSEDYSLVSDHKWYYSDGYAARDVRIDGGHKTILMHRVIANPPDGMQVDHKSGNTLDNRRLNLRVCTHGQNLCNQGKQPGKFSSAYKGVHYFKRTSRWQSRIQVNGARAHLGFYDSEIDAALAYDVAARERHGEYARLNFPDEQAA